MIEATPPEVFCETVPRVFLKRAVEICKFKTIFILHKYLAICAGKAGNHFQFRTVMVCSPVLFILFFKIDFREKGE